MAVLDGDELGHGAHVVFQCPVKWFAGNTLGYQPCQHQAHRPQKQQRREHPVQNFTKQRALLAVEDRDHGRCVTGLTWNLFQAIAQSPHRGNADRAFFNFLAQAVDVNLNGVVADLFTPFAQTFDQLVFADQAASALQQHFKQAQLPCREFHLVLICKNYSSLKKLFSCITLK